jgi:hypothetical protein
MVFVLRLDEHSAKAVTFCMNTSNDVSRYECMFEAEILRHPKTRRCDFVGKPHVGPFGHFSSGSIVTTAFQGALLAIPSFAHGEALRALLLPEQAPFLRTLPTSNHKDI